MSRPSRQSNRRSRYAFCATLLAVLVAGLASGCDRAAGRSPETGEGDHTRPPAAAGAPTPGPVEHRSTDPAADRLGSGDQDGEAGRGETGGRGRPAPNTGFPETAREYAEAVITATHTADLDRLAELTTPLVYEQLLQLPGTFSAQWSWIQCDNVSYCAFYDEAGDYLALQVPVNELGGPHAAVQLVYTTTSFPTEYPAYIKEFTAAWLNGNLARMQALALAEVVAVFQQVPPAPVAQYGWFDGDPIAIAMVELIGTEIETHIDKSMLGGPQAIRKAIRD